MNGRWCALTLSAAALALGVYAVTDGRGRMEASRALFRAEGISMGLIAKGQAPRAYLQQNIRDLRKAGDLDPLEPGIPLALGSQYLLLGSPQAAAEAYRESLAIEPRPETYLNLGKALRLAGDLEGSQIAFDQAVKLDWHLEAEVGPKSP